MEKRFLGLIIMDGFGLGAASLSNAITEQGTPNLDKLMAVYPHTTLGGSGFDVGLPEGQIGNSEVGHLNIGAGRVVYQDITRIDKSIADGDFFANEAFVAAMDAVKAGGKLHLFGLLSNGGVHSTTSHLYSLVEMAKARGVKEICIHGLMDGRDVSPTSGVDFVKELQAKLTEIGVGRIASLMGRYYLMDRDNRWERVERGFNCLTAGKGNRATDPVKVLEESYAAGVTDEFIEPTAIEYNGATYGVDAGDSVIMFNFRSDRAREVSRAFIEPEFKEFERAKGFVKVCYVGMTQYDASFTDILTAYPPRNLTNTLGEYIASLGLRQLRIAETEKYAHVTFFFNGGVEQPNKGEERVLVASPTDVKTYDEKPEMSAYEVTEKAVAAIKSGDIDVMILNLANCDMVGHTGVIGAAKKAVRVVDECVGKVVEAIQSIGGACLITADHGNAEQMQYADGSVCTAHTTNRVPLVLVDDKRKTAKLKSGGKLADIAPTMLKILNHPIPKEMTGSDLVE